MIIYEYKVVPAPKKGVRAKGVKGQDGRFAHALEAQINALAAQGWEYQRTDTLPSEERSGLTGKTTVFQNMLIFRRETAGATQATPALLDTVEETAPAPEAEDSTQPADAGEGETLEDTSAPDEDENRELAAQ